MPSLSRNGLAADRQMPSDPTRPMMPDMYYDTVIPGCDLIEPVAKATRLATSPKLVERRYEQEKITLLAAVGRGQQTKQEGTKHV